MDEDASLEDFLDVGDDQEATPAETAVTDDPDDDVETVDETDTEEADADVEESDAPLRVDPSVVDPATATHDWRPEGAACAACGDVVERRWRDDPGFVCGSCRDW